MSTIPALLHHNYIPALQEPNPSSRVFPSLLPALLAPPTLPPPWHAGISPSPILAWLQPSPLQPSSLQAGPCSPAQPSITMGIETQASPILTCRELQYILCF